MRSMGIEVLLSMQRALWGQITPDLRAVVVSHEGTPDSGSIGARFLYAGDIDDVRLECVSLAEGYCASDFRSGVAVNFQAVPNAISLDLLPDEHYVFMRWEAED